MALNNWSSSRANHSGTLMPLEEVCDVIDSLHQTPQYQVAGIPMIRVTDIRPGFLQLENALRVSETVFKEFTKKRVPRRGDIVFSRVGTYGITSLVNCDEPFCLGQNTALIVPKSHSRYIYYSLQSPFVKRQIEDAVVGSNQKTISLQNIKRLKIPIYDCPYMGIVADILGTLDDKIELNGRMSKTLESIARATFKSWFIDFEPIPGLGFHKEWEDSVLGKIPKGWKNGTWEDLITLEYGKSLKENHAGEGPYPVYGTNGRIGSCHTPLCEHPGIIIGRKGAYRGVHFSSSPFFVIDTAFYVKPRARLEMRWAFYEIIRLDINGMDSGSAIPSTSRDDVYRLPVLIPPYEVQRQFVQLATPLWLRQDHNGQESLTLASIRDALLPKLLLGEIGIKYAEEIVSQVV